MNFKLLALYGWSRSGKDSTARILVRDFGFEQRAMADRIRKILIGLDPKVALDNGDIMCLIELFEQCDHNWDTVKKVSKESVDLMIRLGQACRDVLGIDVWMNSVIPPDNKTLRIVISDLRQPNEYEAIKERGGQVLKIVRPGTEKRGMDGLLDSYDFDAVIYNQGSLVDLKAMVQATVLSLWK